MKRPVRYPDARLRREAPKMLREEVLAVGTGAVQGDIAHDAVDLLASCPDGLALAANQAGSELRFFVVNRQRADLDEHGRKLPTVVCNPHVKLVGPDIVSENEGCLSFPGMYFRVKRPRTVVVCFQHVVGTGPERRVEDAELALDGLWARVFQHEVEHLDGRTFVDDLPQKRRMQIANELRLRMQKQGW